MIRRPIIALLATASATACGRMNFDPISTDASATADAPDCTLSPWSNIVAQSALNGASDEWEPALSPDGLAVAYVSYSTTPGLYAATRTSLELPFGTPRRLTELSTASVEHGPAWSADGTKLYFSREMGTSMPLEATYLGGATFSSPTTAALPPEGYAFAVSADELEVFLTIDGAADLDLGHATRQTTSSAWQLDTVVDTFNTTGADQAFPALDEPRNDLYFQKEGTSGAVIFVAHRPARGAPFGTAVSVGELSIATSITGDPSLTADGLTIAFASDRPNGEGASDIYLATRTCN